MKKSNKKQKNRIHHRMVHHTKRAVRHSHAWYKNRHIVHRIMLWIVTIIATLTLIAYGIAFWYANKHRTEPLELGVTFIPAYARHYDLDPKETMQAIIDDLQIKRFRLVSYWDIHEPVEDKYNFDELDWQFKKAEEAGATVSLAIGLRQPRWPECHMPKWAEKKPMSQWRNDLKDYMKVVIERYKNSPALESYQLENEFFMKVFGICPDHSKERLIDEYNFVKQLDPTRQVIVSRSNNWVGIPIGEPRPDQFGISIYKRVWDKNITKRYFEYPFPPWFYGFLAGAGELATGKDMIIHELQAEPWAPTSTKEASIEEQNKSVDPERLRARIKYGIDTGMRKVDIWGVEWWYWRKKNLKDPSIWEAGKETILKYTAELGKSDGQR